MQQEVSYKFSLDTIVIPSFFLNSKIIDLL
jgi:hypothetical protein